LRHSRSGFNLPPMSFDRTSAQPMYMQFSAALKQAIRAGQLPAGSPLPSTRAAARLFGVSRNTVVTAYEILAADELIESATGSGTRVRRAGMIARFKDPDGNFLYLNSGF
jgi:DNA-binding GntR family transcriptional regulator